LRICAISPARGCHAPLRPSAPADLGHFPIATLAAHLCVHGVPRMRNFVEAGPRAERFLACCTDDIECGCFGDVGRHCLDS